MGYVHVIPEIFKRVNSEERPFKLYGSTQSRAFCYISDAINAMKLIMAKANSEAVNVGNDCETLISDLYETIFEIMDCSPDTVEVPPAPASVERRCPDITKARGLGFEPEVSLKEGIEKGGILVHC